MIYTHVARKGPAGVTSPLDLLADLTTGELEAAVAATRGVRGRGDKTQRRASRRAFPSRRLGTRATVRLNAGAACRSGLMVHYWRLGKGDRLRVCVSVARAMQSIFGRRGIRRLAGSGIVRSTLIVTIGMATHRQMRFTGS
jgi:hypothetical protein